ncbi:nucleoside 2-deoxyribosyltransferase [Xanthobacter versatilis]|uniref:Nucleoside 2-deoxyribosyltransferase n=1 Tax=Xanthobacter autotrophicus (strain ATCC BAA-1158 / Py2) TaxID=78245 RepID=A7IM74_XANP2|nr:nucleoside 2-deoxyribosyltransferase [Xanthobacter autotrophicus Py2]
MKLYLAGPEVFLDDAREIGRRKVELCTRFGFIGLYPLDGDPLLDAAAGAASHSIFAANLALMRSADALIANLTPFRGISADPGTAFEVGFAFALGKPVAAYSNLPGELKHRAHSTIGVAGDAEAVPTLLADGLHVEDFGHFDNLMLAEALAASRLPVIQAQAPAADPFRDLTLFEQALSVLAEARSAGRLGTTPSLSHPEPAGQAHGEETFHG